MPKALHPRTSWRYVNNFTYLLTYLKISVFVSWHILVLSAMRHVAGDDIFTKVADFIHLN